MNKDIKITIRRANQIGGCITIIEHDGCKIIIDLGSNLPGSRQEELSKENIDAITAGTNAIFYTHYHGDHTGLHHLVNPNIPQYIGEGAKDVMICKYEVLCKHDNRFMDMLNSAEHMKTYVADQPIEYSGAEKIKVTPYFVSHSAFDAYMFKIECNGIKILHTGDFRKHGYLGKSLFKMLGKYVGQVDLLITEGTMLGRRQEKVVTENDIKMNVIDVLKKNKYVFALCSSTDLDRLASFHAACKETGRVFFVDQYQQDVLDVFSNYAGKKSDLFKFDQTFRLINFRTKNVVQKLKHEGFLMPVRSGMEYLVKGMLDVYNDEDAWLIYSMWNGYAEEDKEYTNDKILNIRNLFGKHIYDGSREGFHTSGHADVNTLEDVCALVNPSIGVIPIHKDENTQYDMQKVKGYKIFQKSEIVTDKINIILE